MSGIQRYSIDTDLNHWPQEEGEMSEEPLPGWTDMACVVCGKDLTDIDPAHHYWHEHKIMPKPDPKGGW